MDKELEQEVRKRARGLFEYCLFPEKFSTLRHVIDHIIAQQHNGKTILENLALSCGRCNLHKGPNTASVDPVSGDLTPLFNPRIDVWRQHFRLDGGPIVELTAIGRVTINVLALNLRQRIAVRRALIAIDAYSEI